MEKRTLGSSELWVSMLGMGCWQYGGGSYWGVQSQKDVQEVVHQALDLGVNYFDTAELYNEGASERSLGEALKGRRHQAVIGSKISTTHTRPSTLRQHCEASLKRLQTDYIDLYMLHWPLHPQSMKYFTNDAELIKHPPDVHDVFGMLQQLQMEGKIRYIGISNHGVKQMKQVQSTGAPVVANQLPYNLFSRAIEESILPHCVQQEIGIIGYIPLLQGLLSGKYTSFDEMNPLHVRTRHFHYSRGEGTRHHEEGAEKEMLQALQELNALAVDLGVSLLTLSLAWTAANPHISTTIVGSRTREQLLMNHQAASYELTPDVVLRLNEITEPVRRKLGSNADYYESLESSRIY